MTASQVVALRASTTSGFRRALIRERLRDSFWVVPAIFLALGGALAAVTVYAPSLGLKALVPAGPQVDPGEALGVLGIIASATLTFLGVVFSLTLVALQLASSQLSPRVLRMFVRSRVTKLAFGVLLATFSFAVSFLVLSGGRHHEPDSRGLTVALALVTLSLLVFIWYVAKTMRLLQVAWVITAVAGETQLSVARHYPPAADYLISAAPAAAPPHRFTMPHGRRRLLWPGGATRLAPPRTGVLQAVDHRRLVRLAQRHDCMLQLLVRIGEYVPTGGAVAAALGPAPAGRDVLAGLSLGRARTLHQDPAYGIRQLVDIAIQALSPAVNQPTTAVQVIDRLEDILLRIAASPQPTGYYADDDGTVRFVEPVLHWDEWLELAFSEITAYGAGSAQVTRRLLAAYDALEQAALGQSAVDDAAGRARHTGLEARRAALLEKATDLGVPAAELAADALGLG